MGGRVTYALGYTGLGVGTSRWAAGVVRDFIAATRRGPAPAADRGQSADPHPARADPVDRGRHRSAASSTARTASEGRRSVLLRTLDALGIGFDS